MINKVAAKGRKMVTIIDPHIKKDDNYFIHKEATEKGYYVKDKSGADYEGWCWPGEWSFIKLYSWWIRSQCCIFPKKIKIRLQYNHVR